MIRIIAILLLVFVSTVRASEIDHQLKPKELSGKLLYLKDGNIWCQDLTTSEQKRLTNDGKITNYSISADNTLIVFAKKQYLYLFNLSDGKSKFIRKVDLDVTPPSISPDNKVIAYISKSESLFKHSPYVKNPRRHIWLLDIATNKSKDITPDLNFEHSDIKWSPDGKHISFQSYRDKDWKFYVMNVNDTNLVTDIGEGNRLIWLNNETVVMSDKHTVNTVFKWIKFPSVNVTDIREVKEPYNCSQFAMIPPSKIICEDASDNPDFDLTILDLETGAKKQLVTDAQLPVIAK